MEGLPGPGAGCQCLPQPPTSATPLQAPTALMATERDSQHLSVPIRAVVLTAPWSMPRAPTLGLAPGPDGTWPLESGGGPQSWWSHRLPSWVSTSCLDRTLWPVRALGSPAAAPPILISHPIPCQHPEAPGGHPPCSKVLTCLLATPAVPSQPGHHHPPFIMSGLMGAWPSPEAGPGVPPSWPT
nr:splicing factor 3A subunit 2-like [Pongo abelii]